MFRGPGLAYLSLHTSQGKPVTDSDIETERDSEGRFLVIRMVTWLVFIHVFSFLCFFVFSFFFFFFLKSEYVFRHLWELEEMARKHRLGSPLSLLGQ